jgi:hypothetical protein
VRVRQCHGADVCTRLTGRQPCTFD